MKRHTFESRNDIEIQTSKHEFTENTTIYIRQRKSCDFISNQTQLTDRKIKIPANSEESTSKWGKIPGYKTPEDVARMPPCVLNQLCRDKRFERLRRRSGSEDTSCARFEVAVRDGADKKQCKDGEECENSLFNADYNFVDKNDWGNSLGSSLIDSIRNTVHKFVRKEDLNIYTDNTEWDSPSEKRSYVDLDNIPAFPKETKNATIIPICKMRAEKEAGLCKFCRQNSLKQFKDISDDGDNKKGGEEIKLVTSEKISDSNLTKFVPKRAMSQHSEKTSRSNLTKFVPKRAFSEHNLKIDQQTTSDDTRVNINDEDSDGCESDSKSFGSLFKNCDMIPCPRNLLCDQGLHSGRCHEEVRRKLSVPICRDDECACRKMDFMKNDLWLGRVNRGVAVCKSVGALETSLTGDGFMVFGENFNKSRAESCQESENVINRVIVENEEFVVEKEEEEKDGNLDGTPSSSSSTTTVTAPQCRHLSHRARDATSIDSTMNGMNGHHHLYHQHSNGDLNGGGTCGGDIITQNQQKGCWTIGLINSKYRYLTAETFGFKINANGASLKKKQIWTLEPVNSNSSDSLIYLRSHLDKYLAVDSFGNVTCESEEKDPGSKFQISVADDGSGRWALKNVVRGYFLGSSADKLTCTAKVPSDAEFWHVHLAARPQMNLRSVGRKRFAHLSENLDEIHVDANIPWGEDTLFTLEFRLDESGKYAIHTCNNKYLSLGGKLVDQCTKDCLFSAEYHSGQLALRDRAGSYLSPIGSKAVLKTRSNTVTRDELFSLEDSLPQASFVANLNARFVSVKQGVDLTANQDEISDHETFQLEFDWTTKRWYIRTMQDRYWTLETGGGIQASGDKRSSNALFDLAWQQDGSVAFRANNGRYVMTKRSGHLYATADIVDDNSKYYFYLINRPILVLKCEQGFVGYKSAASNKLECNKATYECIQVERGDKGVVYFKGQNGKYWHVDAEGVTADADAQEGFHLELREPTRLCIKACGDGGGGSYLTASKNGLFRLGDANFEAATQWEY